jgi:hypothetical protein
VRTGRHLFALRRIGAPVFLAIGAIAVDVARGAFFLFGATLKRGCADQDERERGRGASLQAVSSIHGGRYIIAQQPADLFEALPPFG